MRNNGMSLKVTGVYFSASSAGAGPGKMKATIRAASVAPASESNANVNNKTAAAVTAVTAAATTHSQSLDYLHMNFEEKRQIIASSLSLSDFIHPPKVKGKCSFHHRHFCD